MDSFTLGVYILSPLIRRELYFFIVWREHPHFKPKLFGLLCQTYGIAIKRR
jgi:hypothetical protein